LDDFLESRPVLEFFSHGLDDQGDLLLARGQDGDTVQTAARLVEITDDGAGDLVRLIRTRHRQGEGWCREEDRSEFLERMDLRQVFGGFSTIFLRCLRAQPLQFQRQPDFEVLLEEFTQKTLIDSISRHLLLVLVLGGQTFLFPPFFNEEFRQ